MKNIVGLKIKEIRPMTESELEAQYWELPRRGLAPAVIVLENGVKLYASRDPEGNGPGTIFGQDGKELFMLA